MEILFPPRTTGEENNSQTIANNYRFEQTIPDFGNSFKDRHFIHFDE